MFAKKLLILLPVLILFNSIEANDKFGQLQHFPKERGEQIENDDHKINFRSQRDIKGNSEFGWALINEEVDIVIPILLKHFQKSRITHLQLPDIKENLYLRPLSLTVGIYLSDGIVYNITGIQRYQEAYMTYKDKSFLSRFYLKINTLKIEYNFVLKLESLEGFGKVIGTLEDTVINAELAIDIKTFRMKLNYFRLIQFSNIHVKLDRTRLFANLTGEILNPIEKLFNHRITTSISDGLKDQVQDIIDDFNKGDPLGLYTFFFKQILGGLTGQKN